MRRTIGLTGLNVNTEGHPAGRAARPAKIMADLTLTNLNETLAEFILEDMSTDQIMDKEDTLDLPIWIAQGKQAFDKLYDDMQEIHTISHRAIRGGTTRYKEALKRIMEICQGME